MKKDTLSRKILLIFCCIYFASAILVPSQLKIFNKASIPDVILLILLAYYFFLLIFTKPSSFKLFINKIFSFISNPLIFSMILLFIVMLLSSLYSANKLLSITEALRFFLYIVVAFILMSEFKNNTIINYFIPLFSGVTIVVNLIGIYQFLTKRGITVTLVNLNSNLFTGRVQSTFGNPNAFGAYLVMAIFPFMLLFLWHKSIKAKLFYFSIILLSLLNLLLTFSRNSWLAFAIGLIILVFTYNWRFIYFIIASGIGMLLIPTFRNRILQYSDSSQNQGRFKIWGIALKMIKEHPIKGIGNGSFSELYDSYVEKYPEFWQENVSHFPSHNSYLKVQSELGIIGFSIFLFIIFNCFKRLSKAYRSNLENITYFYRGFLVSAICFLILNLFDNILFVPQVAIVFWVFIFLADMPSYKTK